MVPYVAGSATSVVLTFTTAIKVPCYGGELRRSSRLVTCRYKVEPSPQHNKVLAVKIWCFPVNVELRYHGLPCEHGLTCWPPSRKPWAAAIQTLLFTILTRTISSRDLLFFFVPIHTHTHSTYTWQMKVILWTDLLHLLASIHHKHALNLRTNGDIRAIYTTAAHSCTSQRKFTYIFTKSKSHKYTPFHYTTPLSVSALSDK